MRFLIFRDGRQIIVEEKDILKTDDICGLADCDYDITDENGLSL